MADKKIIFNAKLDPWMIDEIMALNSNKSKALRQLIKKGLNGFKIENDLDFVKDLFERGALKLYKSKISNEEYERLINL